MVRLYGKKLRDQICESTLSSRADCDILCRVTMPHAPINAKIWRQSHDSAVKDLELCLLTEAAGGGRERKCFFVGNVMSLHPSLRRRFYGREVLRAGVLREMSQSSAP